MLSVTRRQLPFDTYNSCIHWSSYTSESSKQSRTATRETVIKTFPPLCTQVQLFQPTDFSLALHACRDEEEGPLPLRLDVLLRSVSLIHTTYKPWEGFLNSTELQQLPALLLERMMEFSKLCTEVWLNWDIPPTLVLTLQDALAEELNDFSSTDAGAMGFE